MQTIDRVVQLLELLSKYNDGIGINQISETVDLPLSTTHRMLNGLKKDGYVTQDNVSKRYKLGVGILSLAVNMLNNMDIIKITMPFIEDLSTKYGQLMFLSVFENNKIICVDMVNNSSGMKYYVQVGSTMPAYCSASGKIIVAYQDDLQIDKILKSESRTKYTNNTKLDTNEIKRELKMARKLGYAVCNEEMEIGAIALSTPIFNRHGNVFASITIMLVKHLENEEYRIIEDLKEASDKISRCLGYIKI
mgnify:CR=1 FL=1